MRGINCYNTNSIDIPDLKGYEPDDFMVLHSKECIKKLDENDWKRLPNIGVITKQESRSLSHREEIRTER